MAAQFSVAYFQLNNYNLDNQSPQNCPNFHLPGDDIFARLSFAKPVYMEKYLDITPGSVSVLGLMNDSEKKVQLLIDEDVMKEPYFGCHPCINTSSLKFTTEDLMQKIIPALEHEPVTVTLPVPE